MEAHMINGEELIDWIIAKMPHTKKTYELIEYIADEIRHNEERERREKYAINALKEWREDE